MNLKNKTYNILKWISTIVIPAIETFWLTIGDVWDIAITVKVGATLGAIGVLVGALIGVSASSYKKLEAKEAENVLDLEERIENDEVEEDE